MTRDSREILIVRYPPPFFLFSYAFNINLKDAIRWVGMWAPNYLPRLIKFLYWRISRRESWPLPIIKLPFLRGWFLMECSPHACVCLYTILRASCNWRECTSSLSLFFLDDMCFFRVKTEREKWYVCVCTSRSWWSGGVAERNSVDCEQHSGCCRPIPQWLGSVPDGWGGLEEIIRLSEPVETLWTKQEKEKEKRSGP